MMLKFLPMIALAGCTSFGWAADDVPQQRLHRYESVRDVLAAYNQHRIDRSKEFEKDTGTVAQDLPQELQDCLGKKSKNKEFSTIESVNLLFQTVKPGCIVTQVDAMEGGFVSGQIYRVCAYNTKISKEETFFIKYLRTKPILVSKGRVQGEQVNLQALSQSPYLDTVQEQMDVMLPLATYKYGKKVFMIIPSAKGNSFTKLVGDDLGLTVELAFTALGKALGQLHQKIRHFEDEGSPTSSRDFINIKVPSHGDLHGDNVFYDRTLGRLSLIDVETMANSFDKAGVPNSPIFYDMFYMLVMSSKKFGDYMPTNAWAPFVAMFKSYVSVYPQTEREGIYDYLIYCLTHTKGIKFTDLFENFKLTKGFGSGRIQGAKIIAEKLKEGREQFLRGQNNGEVPQRAFVQKRKAKDSGKSSPEQVKDQIEKRYASSSSVTTTSSNDASSSASDQDDTTTAPSKPVSDVHLKNMDIKPGNFSALKAMWETKGTTLKVTSIR